eukprot:CAMPEP_0203747572 /NCGR_PEP_ID=MMETSP0098-20131031/2680_1 /ASSEMBLY_ACC=CAM_ASM_000208 /TAXON_ID=96639 /ORGANISM=" , Strain NY0313808BC1" /LENGTH=570 /DNA_ID=CAMNT_0050636025 /DNA_START=784 /DNA_END=2493 /DNA_ORIENTATION=+
MAARDWLARFGYCLFLTCALGNEAQRDWGELARMTDEFVKHALGIPGAQAHGFVVSVVAGNETRFAKGYGGCKVGDAPCTSKHAFEIGSNTKTFIATGLAYFVSEGIIHWDTPLREILGDSFNVSYGYLSEHVTILDVLAHRTGLGDVGMTKFIYGELGSEMEFVETGLAHVPAQMSFRADYAYSNTAYEIAGVVLEKLCGCPWYEFIEKHFLGPLGMHDTYTGIPRVKTTNAVSDGFSPYVDPDTRKVLMDGYSLLSEATPTIMNGTRGQNKGFLAAGSMLVTAEDMAKWNHFLLYPERYPDIISDPSVVRYTQTGHISMDIKLFPGAHKYADIRGKILESGLGYDFVGNLIGGRPFFSKGGRTVFFLSFNSFLPEQEIAVFVASNSQNYPTAEDLEFDIHTSIARIYAGDDLSTIQSDFAFTEQKTLETDKKTRQAPVHQVSFPLRNGTLFRARGVCAKGNCQLDKKTIGQYLSHAKFAKNDYPVATGTFYQEYYGKLVVRVEESGQLHVEYGSYACTAVPISEQNGNFYCLDEKTGYGELDNTGLTAVIRAYTTNKSQGWSLLSANF